MAGVANKVFARLSDAVGHRVLATDPMRAEYLAPIRGRTLELAIRFGSSAPIQGADPDTNDPLVVQLFITAEHDRFSVRDAFDGQADARISGTLAQFLKLAGGARNTQAVRESGLAIDGNVDTVQAFADVAEQLDIDFEALAARYIGDFPARKLSRALDSVQQFVRSTVDAVAEDQGYYLREDSGLLITSEALDSFVREVDELRADSERLSQRISRLRQHIVTAPSS